MTERHENLLAAYFSGQITDKEREEITVLLDSDSEFLAEFKQMEKAFIAACIPAFEKTKAENYRNNIRKEIAVRRRPGVSFWKYCSAAACLCTVILLGSTLYSQHRYRNAERFLSEANVMTISANNGTGTETVLPDGTKVRLNAESTISFDRHFGRSTRDITLNGEGYFEVAKDASKPFHVYTGNTCVTVKGTTFNVRSYEDEAEITVSLLEGAVSLTTGSAQANLMPGDCAVVSRSSNDIRLGAADPSASDWIKGIMVFSDKTIPEILRSVERHYGVNFVYPADLFAGERFTGNFSYSLSIDEILSYIDVDKKYSWNRHENTIEIK